jgi:hypothetical protein
MLAQELIAIIAATSVEAPRSTATRRHAEGRSAAEQHFTHH